MDNRVMKNQATNLKEMLEVKEKLEAKGYKVVFKNSKEFIAYRKGKKWN